MARSVPLSRFTSQVGGGSAFFVRPTAHMPNPLDKIKINASLFETPFTIRQVETHLIFGPIARYVPFAYVLFGGGIVSLVAGLIATQKPIGQYIGSIFDKLIYLIVPFLLLRMTKRQQAILGWYGFKFGMGVAAFMMATVGAGVSYKNGDPDVWELLVLGVIWIPSIEFIPKVTPYQRYVSLARIALSIPCVYYGIKTGHWHW